MAVFGITVGQPDGLSSLVSHVGAPLVKIVQVQVPALHFEILPFQISSVQSNLQFSVDRLDAGFIKWPKRPFAWEQLTPNR